LAVSFVAHISTTRRKCFSGQRLDLANEEQFPFISLVA